MPIVFPADDQGEKRKQDDSCRSTKNGESCIWLKTHQKQKKGKTMATENEQLLEEQARLRERKTENLCVRHLHRPKRQQLLMKFQLAVLSFVMEKSLPEAITEET